jgi:hypothetical protein
MQDPWSTFDVFTKYMITINQNCKPHLQLMFFVRVSRWFSWKRVLNKTLLRRNSAVITSFHWLKERILFHSTKIIWNWINNMWLYRLMAGRALRRAQYLSDETQNNTNHLVLVGVVSHLSLLSSTRFIFPLSSHTTSNKVISLFLLMWISEWKKLTTSVCVCVCGELCNNDWNNNRTFESNLWILDRWLGFVYFFVH